MRSLPQVLVELHAMGVSPALSPDGKLKVSFGTAKAPASLVTDLRAHADELKELLPRLQARSENTIIDETVGSIRYTKWTPFDVKLKSVIGWDTETVPIDKAKPWKTPRLVLIVATDGDTGYFIDPDNAKEFFEAHSQSLFIAHNAAFDISVVANHIKESIDQGLIWDMVDDGKFFCTQEFERLLTLAFDGISPVRPPSLSVLSEKYLGHSIEKETPDVDGVPIRISFGKYAGQSINVLPQAFLQYAADDAMAPILIHRKQMAQEAKILRDVIPMAFAKLSPEMMAQAREKHGPLGINLWVISSLICRELSRRGVEVSPERCRQLNKQFDEGIAAAIAEIKSAGIDMPEPGQDRPKGMMALSTAVRNRLATLEPDLISSGKISEPLERTATGGICINDECQQAWIEAEIDPVISAYSNHEKLKKQKSFVENIVGTTIHPNWLCGKVSGRFGCSEPNVQQWPKCGRSKFEGLTIRQMTFLESDHLLVAADFAQLEMAALGSVLHHQIGLGQSLWNLINEGVDLYVAVFKKMYDREPSSTERSWMKPPVLGYPAGMGAPGIVKNAKSKYGLELDLELVKATLAAYESLVPELRPYRKSSLNPWAFASNFLDLNSTGKAEEIFKQLGGDVGELTDEDVAENWELAQKFESIIETRSSASLKVLKKALAEHKPSSLLQRTVKDSLTPQPLMTLSGRVRGKCNFSETRNQAFQAAAADGAILCIWQLLRQGFDVRMFVHDEAVVQIKDDHLRNENVQRIEQIMTETMSQHLGGIRIKVDSCVSKSWSELDQVKTPPPPKPKVNSLLKGRVAGTKRKSKVDAVGLGGRKTFSEMVKANEFDDGTLPF